MNVGSKFVFVVAACGIAAGANAFTYYNLASNDLGLTGHSLAQILTVGGPPIGNQSDTSNGQIDFFPSGGGLVAGDSSGVGFSGLSFTYQVNAPGPVGAVGIVLLGTVSGAGRLSFQEDVFRINNDNSETLIGSISNTLFDGGTTNSVGTYHQNGANYTLGDNTNLSDNLVKYKVKKSFFLQVTNWGTGQFNPLHDFVSLGLCQQNHQPVPEPATLATLAVGAIAMIARRRKV